MRTSLGLAMVLLFLLAGCRAADDPSQPPYAHRSWQAVGTASAYVGSAGSRSVIACFGVLRDAPDKPDSLKYPYVVYVDSALLSAAQPSNTYFETGGHIHFEQFFEISSGRAFQVVWDNEDPGRVVIDGRALSLGKGEVFLCFVTRDEVSVRQVQAILPEFPESQGSSSQAVNIAITNQEVKEFVAAAEAAGLNAK